MTKKEIDKLFKESKDQIEIALALYRKAFKDYDKIKQIAGYPKVNKETTEYLFNSFIEFDKINHPQVLPGGLWLNKGFGSSDKNLKFGEIDTSDCKITLKGSN